MKPAIYSLILFICLLVGLKCSKEAQETTPISKVYTIDDITDTGSLYNRNGYIPPFSFPESDVIIDLQDSVQIAFNKRLYTSTDYIRMGNDVLNGFFGTQWGYYILTKHRTNATDTIIKAWAPTVYGQSYTKISTLLNNQLDISATVEYVKLKQTKRNADYYDIKCGKTKRKYLYMITTNNYTGAEMLPPSKCNTYGFSYNLIY